MKKPNRFLSMLLSTIMMLNLFPAAVWAADASGIDNFKTVNFYGNAHFTDSQPTDWFYENVKSAYELGLMVGQSDTSFGAGENLTIAETMAIAARLHAIYYLGKADFAPSTPWYAVYANYCQANNIADVSSYHMEALATRAQFATIMANALPDEALPAINTVADDAIPDVKITDGYGAAVYKLYRAGIVVGNDENGTFAPDTYIKRREMAAISTRMANPSLRQEIHLGTTEVKQEEKVEEKVEVKEKVKERDWDGDDSTDDSEPIKKTTYTVTFDSNDGETVPAQQVKAGECAEQPNDPERENFTFIGWYYSNGFSYLYDFADAIESNITIYAKWFDNNDTTDSDADGLTDALEITFGTDSNKVDTDGDGISDYTELNWLNYNPLKIDSDGNGVVDSDEDFDGDGITNIQEINLGTDLVLSDTDNDDLTDSEEISIYKTNPLEKDTDSDGADDGSEVAIGSDPLTPETVFETEVETKAVNELNPVSASAVVKTDAEGAGSLEIEEVSVLDNPLLTSDIPGYLGSAYNFTTDGDFISATLKFTYDKSLGNIGPDFQPRIYYFDETTGLLEELENQTITDGIVSANVTHFSTYILLNKVDFDSVWETEIKAPITDSQGNVSGIDVVFVIDVSGSMSRSSRLSTAKTALNTFLDALSDKDRAALVKFSSSATTISDLTSDIESVQSYVSSLSTSGQTSMYKGFGNALDLLTNSEITYGYKMIIILSDGIDEPSTSYSGYYADLVQSAKDNNIVVYTVGAGTDVDTSILSQIASNTSGAYYAATVTDGITDAFADIQAYTVDLTTDSNGDGISDYYTELLNDGTLPLSTGSYELMGVIDDYGLDSDDWDGDGLKNGEEIEISVDGTKVYARMISNPRLSDSDSDGYDDSAEKAMGTPPLKYTSASLSSLNSLENDSLYNYVGLANEQSVNASINAFFDWNKTEEAKQLYINYFYDYASESTISANEEAISELVKKEQLLQWIKSTSNCLHIAKGVIDIVDDIEDINGKSTPSKDQEEFVTAVREKNIEIEGASQQIRRARKVIYDNLNSKKFDVGEAYRTIISTTDDIISLFEEISDITDSVDTASCVENITSSISKLTSTVGHAVGAIKTTKEIMTYVKLDNGFKALSDGYKNFLKEKGEISGTTWFGAAITFVDAAVDIQETSNTYSKMKANRDAYLGYMDLLYYMSEHADEDYVKSAAYSIASIIADESWSEYESELASVNGKILAVAVIEAILDVASDACPYVKVANLVYKAAKTTISVVGISANAQAYVQTRSVKAISDGCIHMIEDKIVRDSLSSYFSYADADSDYVISYMTQLAQSRVVGEDYMRQWLLRNTGASLLARLLGGFNETDIEEEYVTAIGRIYDRAEALDLTLSSKLPYYSKFVKGSGGGGGGGR